MDTSLTSVKAVFTFLLGLITDIFAVIVANPIMLIPIAAGLVGTGIAIFKKLKGR